MRCGVATQQNSAPLLQLRRAQLFSVRRRRIIPAHQACLFAIVLGSADGDVRAHARVRVVRSASKLAAI